MFSHHRPLSQPSAACEVPRLTPHLASSQEAKRYAAMCAMRCVDHLNSSPNQHASNSTASHHPPVKATESEIQDPGNTNGPRLAQAGQLSTPSGSDTSRAASPSARKKMRLEGDEPDATRQIPGLCTVLGMMVPQFQVTPVRPSPSSPSSTGPSIYIYCLTALAWRWHKPL